MKEYLAVIVTIGFIALALILFYGLDNIANNQPKSEFESCMEALKYESFKTWEKVALCNEN